jgi:hypothetical protein
MPHGRPQPNWSQGKNHKGGGAPPGKKLAEMNPLTIVNDQYALNLEALE